MDKNKSSRRSVLKSISTGLVTTTGLTGVSVAQESGTNQNGGVVNQGNNSPFNPNDLRAAHVYAKKELRVSDSDNTSREKIIEKFNALPQANQKAISKVLSTDSLEVKENDSLETSIASDDVSASWSAPYVGKEPHRSLVGKDFFGDKLWTLTHDCYFEYNGAGDVRNIQPYVRGQTHAWPWYFSNGSKSSTVQDKGGSFEAYGSCTFRHCTIKQVCYNNISPWIKIFGNYTGSVRSKHSNNGIFHTS